MYEENVWLIDQPVKMGIKSNLEPLGKNFLSCAFLASTLFPLHTKCVKAEKEKDGVREREREM